MVDVTRARAFHMNAWSAFAGEDSWNQLSGENLCGGGTECDGARKMVRSPVTPPSMFYFVFV